jgi:cell division protein FtsI (penicillin-binding protein 3)
VFQRVTQQVLEYLHTPHDVELPPSRQVLLAERRVKEQDAEEGSPDRLGDSLEAADFSPPDATPPVTPFVKPSPDVAASAVVPAALRERDPSAPAASEQKQKGAMPTATEAKQPDATPTPARLPSSGTVVLEVEQGGIVVPSFLGKSVRAAIETAQDSGLDLDAVGSGLAREQAPAPGSHVASGSQVTVKFGR